MFSDPVFLVIAGLIILVGVIGVTIQVVKRRYTNPDEKLNDTLIAVLTKIRPIILECAMELNELAKAQKMGYEAMVDYAVKFIKEKIDASTVLTNEEKQLLSERVIKMLIEPELKEIYDRFSKK